nr:MAG TPA: hypothetical protein [Caudoviricetes sp.]
MYCEISCVRPHRLAAPRILMMASRSHRLIVDSSTPHQAASCRWVREPDGGKPNSRAAHFLTAGRRSRRSRHRTFNSGLTASQSLSVSGAVMIISGK